MLPDLKTPVVYVLAVLVFVLGLATWHYRGQAKVSAVALKVQSAAIATTNQAARDLLKRRTAERDALQAELDKRRAAQENTDEKAVSQIAADDRGQRSAPVRVRVLDCTRDAGRSGGGAPGEAARAADAGAADAGAASGVLPQAGARRLADALTEIETMSAAYASCRATLILRGTSPQ